MQNQNIFLTGNHSSTFSQLLNHQQLSQNFQQPDSQPFEQQLFRLPSNQVVTDQMQSNDVIELKSFINKLEEKVRNYDQKFIRKNIKITTFKQDILFLNEQKENIEQEYVKYQKESTQKIELLEQALHNSKQNEKRLNFTIDQQSAEYQRLQDQNTETIRNQETENNVLREKVMLLEQIVGRKPLQKQQAQNELNGSSVLDERQSFGFQFQQSSFNNYNITQQMKNNQSYSCAQYQDQQSYSNTSNTFYKLGPGNSEENFNQVQDLQMNYEQVSNQFTMTNYQKGFPQNVLQQQKERSFGTEINCQNEMNQNQMVENKNKNQNQERLYFPRYSNKENYLPKDSKSNQFQQQHASQQMAYRQIESDQNQKDQNLYQREITKLQKQYEEKFRTFVCQQNQQLKLILQNLQQLDE
eukprot:403347712